MGKKIDVVSSENRHTNGFLDKSRGGVYEGTVDVDGVNLSPISGVYFKEGGKHWLWLKRKETLEYDIRTSEYKKKKAVPYWECYLEKQKSGAVAYKGYFIFCHFRYQITGIWDRFLTDVDRLNLFVERLPMSDQTIINNINLRNKENYEKRQRDKE